MGRSGIVIVVPIYKALNKFEEFSILNLNKVLRDYDKIVVCPKNLDIDLTAFIDSTYKIVKLPNRNFKSIKAYNKLLRSKSFFQIFTGYKFMLMHHTDAFVFRDELVEWGLKNLDYIGAPLYEFDGSISPSKYLCNGNGGLSMHKVESALRVLSSYKTVYSISELFEWWKKYNWKGRIRYLPYVVRLFLGIGRNSHSRLNIQKINEDVFWGFYVPRAFEWYVVANFEDAYKFSMEYNCRKLLEKNNFCLPFGCHQWYKGDFYNFWKNYIPFND